MVRDFSIQIPCGIALPVTFSATLLLSAPIRQVPAERAKFTFDAFVHHESVLDSNPSKSRVCEGAGFLLFMSIDVIFEVFVFPEVSLAMAVILCIQPESVVVSRLILYGLEISSHPIFTLSTRNWTHATPLLSVALAERFIVQLYIRPFIGKVIDTVGGVLSVDVELTPTSSIVIDPTDARASHTVIERASTGGIIVAVREVGVVAIGTFLMNIY